MSDKLNQDADEYAGSIVNRSHALHRSTVLSFKAGHASRDAEVELFVSWIEEMQKLCADKDAEILQLKEKLWVAEGRLKGMTDGLEILKGEK